MAMMFLVGADPNRRTTTQEFKLGTAYIDDSNRSWVYVKANVAVAAAAAPVMNATTFLLTAATGGAYTADAAFLANEFGWVRKTTTPF